MGRLYSSERVFNGDLPAADGSDHVEAARKFLCAMREIDSPDSPLSGMTFGSVITGNANRRSDVDFLIIYSTLEQLEALGALELDLAEQHNVVVEAQTFQAGAFDSPATHDVSPLFGSHLLDVQDNYPQWSHGSPVEALRSFVIGPDSTDTENDAEEVLRDVMSYAHYKLRLFANACLMSRIKGGKDLYVMQRSLELPKGLGRKAAAIVSVMGEREIDLDVTDRAAMQESFAHLVDVTGDRDMMPAYTDLVQLDEDYDELLEDAASSGGVVEYDRWLDENSQDAAQLAHDLTNRFSVSVKELAEQHGVGLDEAPLQATR